MDPEVVRTLSEAGFDVSLAKHLLGVVVEADESRRPKAVADEVMVAGGGAKEPRLVRLRAIPELFAGDARPPDFSLGPAPAYQMFFILIERTVAGFCHVTRRMETDEELDRLCRRLVRRPGGTDRNPLFSYVQAAFRLCMSLRDVSHAEFDAVATRLAKSARTFRMGPLTTNYVATLTGTVL